jgi:hypothetical protein
MLQMSIVKVLLNRRESKHNLFLDLLLCLSQHLRTSLVGSQIIIYDSPLALVSFISSELRNYIWGTAHITL